MAYKYYSIPEMSHASGRKSSATCTSSQLQEDIVNDCEDVSSETAVAGIKIDTYQGFVPIVKQQEPAVQIRAGKQEVYRRIRAFQALKREEVNESNIQEFCVESHHSQKDWTPSGCARVDSLILPRPGCKTHIKVHRVVNEWGPYSEGLDPSTLLPCATECASDPNASTAGNEDNSTRICQKCRKAMLDPCPFSIDDRLATAEYHLKMTGPVSRDIYERIKEIENRILALEGSSPEYAAIPLAESYTRLEKEIPVPVLFGHSSRENAARRKKKISQKPIKLKKGHKKHDLQKQLLKFKIEEKLEKLIKKRTESKTQEKIHVESELD